MLNVQEWKDIMFEYLRKREAGRVRGLNHTRMKYMDKCKQGFCCGYPLREFPDRYK